MAVIIAFANQKGGVGKSTFTLQTAYFASEKKLKTLVVDMDGQGNSSTKLAGREVVKNLSQDITRSYQLFDPDMGVPVPIRCKNGVDLIPAIINDTKLYSKEAADLSSIVHPKNNLNKIVENYDLILIDCPPSLGRLLMSGLIISNKVIIPVAVSGFAVDGVSGLFSVIDQIKKGINPSLEISGVFVNNFNVRSAQHKKSVQALRESVGSLLLNTVVGNRSPIDQATNTAVPVWKLRSGAASKASVEIQGVIQEIFERTGVVYE